MNYQVEILRHGDPEEKQRLFCTLGEFFASAQIRRELGIAMTSDERYVWFVAREEGEEEVTGFAALRIDGEKADLCHAYTFEDWRGNGVNWMLVLRRIDYAVENGAYTMTVTVHPDREAVYVNAGFELQRRSGQYGKYALEVSRESV